MPLQQSLGTHLWEVLNDVCDCRTVEDANNVPGTKPVDEECLVPKTKDQKFRVGSFENWCVAGD